jgi:hypothetical protein
MSEAAVPTWKFWHPLPLWQVFLIAFVAQVVCIFPIIALRELAGIRVPEWIGSGLAGMLMVVTVRAMANRRLARRKEG